MNAYINAIDYYLPEKVLTNQDLAALFPEWNAEKIFAKIGIEQRHISGCNESASDMAVKAAEKLFANNAAIKREEIDFVLFCTQSPDYKLPSSACIIQDKLQLSKNAGALDFNMGCSGFIYGLALAKGLIISGAARNILLLTGETYTKYISPDDKSNRAIFGDGASAALISERESGALIGDFVLGTDGSRANDLILRPGEYLYMNGANIFSFALEIVPVVVRDVLAKNNIDSEEIDLYVFHQANKFLLDSLRRKMNIPEQKFFMNLQFSANTVSATIAIALKDALTQGRINKDSCVLLAGFGVGLSWGANVLFY